MVSRHLGELLDTDLVVDELKEIAREIADKQRDERAVPEFEISGATYYETGVCGHQGAQEAEAAIRALSPDAWMVIEEMVIKV